MCLPYAICPGLPYSPRCCYFARVSAYIPAIYLHSGRVAGLPVAGLMMTGPVDDDEKVALFLLPKFWPSLPPLVLVPSSGLRPWLRVHRQKGPFFYYLHFGDVLPKVGFFGRSGCGGIPSRVYSFLPSSSLPKIQAIKKGTFWVPSSWCWLLALSGRSFGSLLYILGFLVNFGGFLCCLLPVFVPSAGYHYGHY